MPVLARLRSWMYVPDSGRAGRRPSHRKLRIAGWKAARRSLRGFRRYVLAMTAGEDATNNTIVVIGEGSVTVAADAAVLQVGLETRADSAGEALSLLTERSEAVLAAAKRLRTSGVANHDLQTRGLSLSPQMDDRGRRVVGYVASYSLSVHVGDLGAAPAIVDAISLAAGDALRLGGFGLSVSTTDIARADACARAVDDARRRAQRLAEAAGVRLGRVLSIKEWGTGPRFPKAHALVAARAAAPPVEAGSDELTARVTVSFEIVD